MHLSLGPIVRPFSRCLYALIEGRKAWYEPIQLTKDVSAVLQFWLDNINSRNGFTFKTTTNNFQGYVQDASDTGYGDFVAERLNKVICVFVVAKSNSFEKMESSTSRELSAVKYVLQSFIHK